MHSECVPLAGHGESRALHFLLFTKIRVLFTFFSSSSLYFIGQPRGLGEKIISDSWLIVCWYVFPLPFVQTLCPEGYNSETDSGKE